MRWLSVIPEDRKYGLPTKIYADLVIDGQKKMNEIMTIILAKLSWKEEK